ncbi:MAG: glycosyltransferase [Gammaproteobacteria bacterium]|nr:glycosyltransferase [Gammaproteobacteria bacterium]
MIRGFQRGAGNLRRRLDAKLELRTVLDKQLISVLYGSVLLAAGMLSFSRRRRLHFRIVALRRFEQGAGLAVVQRSLRRWLQPQRVAIWRERHIGWQRYYGDFGAISREPKLKTSLLLKEPGPGGEKGVLYSSFEYNWMKILAGRDPRKYFRDYILVGATSWSPSDYAVFANLCGLSEDPMFMGVSNLSDLQQYRTFLPCIFPVPILACDWCDPDLYKPRPRSQRSIDILMMAHFTGWKRHWLLFEALKHMPRNMNVVLLGRATRLERDIREEAKAFGVRQDLTVVSGLDIDEVAAYECNAKVSVSLSKREGSCVGVTESMFADTPVVMMQDAHIGARAHINSSTGRIARRGELHRVLSEMLEDPSKYNPRAWACENISARQSSQRLNAILRDHSLKAGKPWTQDIAALCWRYVPRYLDNEDAARLRPGIERMRERHGIELEEFVSERVARARNQEQRRNQPPHQRRAS